MPQRRLSNDAVRWAYRLILGREPTSADDLESLARLGSFPRLAHRMLFVDPEFRSSERGRRIAGRDHVAAPREPSGALRRLLGRGNGVTREAVLWTYRIFLDREPESEWVIGEKLKARDDVDLVRTFFHSEEFGARSRDWAEDFADAGGGLPLPPLALRRTVGPTDRSSWDLPEGALAFGEEVDRTGYRSVFDFGCGCGRTARQLLRQVPPPERYLGIDLHPGSIAWCRENLTPIAPSFEFRHHDAYNAGFNPGGRRERTAFPTGERFSLVSAHSVFTHIVEPEVDHYLSECKRVLAEGGAFRATWFLFDKTAFPMMQERQNSLYIQVEDPTNAVLYDYRFVESRYRAHGLAITRIFPPSVQGFHWALVAGHAHDDVAAASFPADLAPKGIVRPPAP